MFCMKLIVFFFIENGISWLLLVYLIVSNEIIW